MPQKGVTADGEILVRTTMKLNGEEKKVTMVKTRMR